MPAAKPILKLSLMLLFNRYYFLVFFIFAIPAFSEAQPCSILLTGRVTDESTGVALPFATVYIETDETGAVTDSAGFFRIENLCSGNHLVKISHVGCEPKRIQLFLDNDKQVNFSLNHFSAFLNEVVVHGKNGDNTTQISTTIASNEIQKKSNENIADILESIQGVSTLRNGTGISKPVIHGLYGNRVTILNNGIAQSGQQWGNDHAPEIDPYIADHLAVIKGASALQYSGSSLGGVVLADTRKIDSNPLLKENINYIFQSNGRGNTVNTQFEKGDKWALWRFTGTLKLFGDAKAPGYFLTNTGKKEANMAVQLEKKLTQKWNTEIYYSLFETEIGILRGSHIGNTTDLKEAMSREVPFFTKPNFSYQIESPSQRVTHHLLKMKAKYQPGEKTFFDFTYGGQINNRREYDVRRGERSDIPALSLAQTSQFLQASLYQNISDNATFKAGVSGNYTDNTNNPETGILPLIPDYQSTQAAGYVIFQNKAGKLFYEFGGRYDFEKLNVWTISQTLPRKVEKHQHTFKDRSFSAGSSYPFSDLISMNVNIGYTSRSPEINELYSFGLHQGVSGIEEGDPNLSAEKSVKLVVNTDWKIPPKVNFQVLGYYQQINDFIYLQPQQEFRLTLRGAFPVYIYHQADSRIYGADFLFSYEPFHRIRLTAKYAFVNGWNLDENIPLVNIPAPNFLGTLAFFPHRFMNLKDSEISFSGKYVFRQNNLLPEQDFMPPPDGYFLMSMEASAKKELSKSMLKFSVFANNLFNVSYRDYLNRLRYFADEPGISINIGVNYSF